MKFYALKWRLPLIAAAAMVVCSAHNDDDSFFDDAQGFFAAQTTSRTFIDNNGDTTLMVVVPPVFCFAKTKFRSHSAQRKYYEQYYKMIYNLKVVYPYAQRIKQQLATIEHEYSMLSTQRERKAYLKRMEAAVFAEFKPIAKRMTISQGKMLIKLVNRETGKTGYVIVKELKGTISAFFWQTIAVMFSQSLKSKFDPLNDDKLLNELIYLYENGWL